MKEGDQKRAQYLTDRMVALRVRADTLRLYNPSSLQARKLERQADALSEKLRNLFRLYGVSVIN
jgi:hypothetical protein